MSYLAMDEANRLYECARTLTVQRVAVRHSAFRQVCRELQTFLRLLDGSDNDPYWQPFVRWIKRYRFRCLSSPIPFNHPSIYTPEEASHLRTHLKLCSSIYPDLADPAVRVLDLIEGLAFQSENPLLEALSRLVEGIDDSKTIVVLKDSSALKVVEDQVPECSTALGAAHLVPWYRIPSTEETSHLVIIGSPHWFPLHLFSAPKAPALYVVNYEWTFSRIDTSPLFEDGVLSEYIPPIEAPAVEEDTIELGAESNVHGFLSRIRDKGQSSDPTQFEVDARLLILEDDQSVLLPVGASALVIDLQDQHEPVIRKMVTNLEPGMFLLLRQGGGGDYIPPIADRLLGTQSEGARQIQRHWKQLLRIHVAAHGLSMTCSQLEKLGATHANPSNLRNWMSDSTIRTWDHRDFEAVMGLVDLPHRFEEYWNVLAQIDKAHRSAGRLIRKDLLRKVHKSDLYALNKIGHMDFELEEGSGVTISALRIVETPPDNHSVPNSQLYRLLDMEGDDEWLA